VAAYTALALLHRVAALYRYHPFAGSRMLRDLLRQKGYAVGCKHDATLTPPGIDLKTAKPTGITFPQSFLVRADTVIE
jgi:hypothetical protein